MNGGWRPLDELPNDAEVVAKSQAFLYRAFELDITAFLGDLTNAPPEPVHGFRAHSRDQVYAVVSIPMPDGSTEKFAVVETPAMAPELAARFASIRVFAGESLESPGTSVRCSLTSRGFHALVLSPRGTVVVNPAARTPTDRTEHYISFRYEDSADAGMEFQCTVLGDPPSQAADRAAATSTPLRGTSRNDMTVAFLPTAEWTILHGNSIETALSAMVELTTRVNAIYERELCVRLIIAGEQDRLIQFDPVTDGLTNSDSSTMLSQATGIYNRLTPALSCQLRHILGTAGGGIASLSSACSTNPAVTSSGLPIENVYTVMVVAHEMGHQFGSHHTFGGRGEFCASGAGRRVEPGSGSTIMSYAQQCYPDNIVLQPELQFHADYLPTMAAKAACGGVVVPLENTAPTITLPTALVLRAPLNTPLLLPSALADADGDSVSVSWDQIDNGTPAYLTQGDLGNNAIIRTFLPNAQGTRVIPQWETLLNGAVSPGEQLPTRVRTLKFRAFARDNRAGGGGGSYQDVWITASATSGSGGPPFALLTPQDGTKRSGGPILVTWAVANTNAGSFTLANVEISLMRSDDDRDPLVLASSTPNDGSEVVTLPDLPISRARVIVRPINGVFFDISRKPFEIIPRTSGPALHIAGLARISDSFANGNNNARIDSGESGIQIYFPAVNAGSDVAVGSIGELVSHTPTARVVVSSTIWPNIPPGAGAENATPFVVEVSPDHPCGTPIDLELTLLPNSSRESHLSFQLPVGDTSRTATSTFDYAGSPALIPDGNPTGVSVPLTVPSLPGPVTDAKLRILGESTTDPSRPDAGINHPYVGDLVLRLSNPHGATITIADRPGGVGNFGSNFSQTLFDMKQIVRPIQSITPGSAPYAKVYFPKEDLNLLTGDSGVGVWTLQVADMRAGQWPQPVPTLPSALRKFRLELTCQLPPACAAPKPYCEGDLNLDGVVTDADFEVFIIAYNALINSAGDLDGDTLTTDADFTPFVQAYDALVCP
jgi:hypothetical protein